MHVTTLDAPIVVEYLPVPHSTQSVEALLPTDCRYLPAMQFVQIDSPSDDENLPFSQSTQSVSWSLAVVARYFPALQRVQNDSVEEPRTVEYLPTPQTPEQADEPTPAANLPGRQKEQIAELKFAVNLP
jgi:hypothetical protein